MRAADIEKLVSVGRPEIAPDGSFAVFATSRPDLAANRAVGQLWRVDLPAGEPRRMTRGTADSTPRLSPDAARIAFLRLDAKGKSQVHVVEAGGGEPVQATDAPLGVESFDWSDDGASLAYTARIPEKGRYGSVDGLDAAAEAPRRITGVRWHSNALGYMADRPAQLFVVPAPGLESEPFYEPAAAVRAGGRRAAEEEARRRTSPPSSRMDRYPDRSRSSAAPEVLTVEDEIEHDRRDLSSRLVAVRADGSGERELIGRAATLSISAVTVAADGAIAVLAAHVGPSGIDFVAPGVSLWLLEADGPRALTDPETIDLGEVGSHITADGDDFLVQDRRRGRVRLLRVTRSGEVEEVLGGDVEVGGHAAAAGRVVASVATPDSLGELVLAEGGSTRTLTSFGADVASITPRRTDDHGPRRISGPRVGRAARRRWTVPGRAADPWGTVCHLRHTSVR